jgi:N-acetylglucosamine-6-phosphate deacetylase
MVTLAPKYILFKEKLIEDHYIELRDNKITQIGPLHDLKHSDDVIEYKNSTIAQGLFDIQINGGDGILFNDAPSVASIERVSNAHRRFGTTSLLPTVISDELCLMREMARSVEQALDAKIRGIKGIHFEGPFLNPERKGVHNEKFMRQKEADFLSILDEFQLGHVLVTLAPEKVSPGFIKDLHSRGVRISAGHSAATYNQIHGAVKLGLSGFTHLYNAMTPTTAREPGVVGAALELHQCFSGIIADGHHIHKAVLKQALAALSTERAMLVSDAMPCAASDITEFMLGQRRVTVTGGKCITEEGTLAGSAITLSDAVHYCISKLGCSVEDTIKMASTTPAYFMGLSDKIGSLEIGRDADLILLKQNGDISLIEAHNI